MRKATRDRGRGPKGTAKKDRPTAVRPERFHGRYTVPSKVRSAPLGRIVVFALILATATIFAYRPAWNGDFIWDDDKYVTKNPLLTAPDGLWRIWFSLDSPSQYFPLTYTTF